MKCSKLHINSAISVDIRDSVVTTAVNISIGIFMNIKSDMQQMSV